MRTIYKYELRRGRTTTIIFTAIVSGLVIFCMALYPMMKDMLADMSVMLADMGEFSEMFSMDELNYASAQDYFATEGGIMISLCGAMLAAFLGGSLLGREESERTGEWLLTHPIPRSRVFVGKFLAMATLLFILNVVAAVLSGVCFPIINEPLQMDTFLMFFIAQYLMHIEIGCMCLVLSALMRRSAGPIGLGIAMVLYFVSLMAASLEELEFLTYVTPFSYSDAASIFTGGELDFVRMGIGIGLAVICGITAQVIWCRKDISA